MEEAAFQIPQPVREDRKVSLGMKWLILSARNRNEKTMAVNLSSEIIGDIKKKERYIKRKWILIEWLKQIKHFLTFQILIR